MRSVVRPEARFPQRAEDVAQTLVAEEVDALVCEIELDAFGGRLCQTSASRNGLVSGRNLWRRLKIQVAFRRKLLNEAVEQLAQFLLRFFRSVATERLE